MPESAITLNLAELSAAVTAEHWWEQASLRRILPGKDAAILGYERGPDPASPEYAFLAADLTHSAGGTLASLRRFVVLLRETAVVSFDLARVRAPGQNLVWRLEPGAAEWSHRSILPRPGDRPGADRLFLNVMLRKPAPVDPVSSTDLAGARIGNRVVLFNSEPEMARSAVHFDVEGTGRLEVLVIGLAPGWWEVWWNGYLEEAGVLVRPQAGLLRFEGEAGGYFLRRR